MTTKGTTEPRGPLGLLCTLTSATEPGAAGRGLRDQGQALLTTGELGVSGTRACFPIISRQLREGGRHRAASKRSG